MKNIDFREKLSLWKFFIENQTSCKQIFEPIGQEIKILAIDYYFEPGISLYPVLPISFFYLMPLHLEC